MAGATRYIRGVSDMTFSLLPVLWITPVERGSLLGTR
jgi:hypothetical protein